MAEKQRKKTLRTRSELKETALRLIAEKGCDGVSVADIVNEAGYSVGAFYGHFKTKQALCSELWVEHVCAQIEKSVEGGSRIKDREAFIDYLITRSDETSRDPLNRELRQYTLADREASDAIGHIAARYTSMIENALAQWAPQASRDTLWTTASIMHSVLNAHAQRFFQETYYSFDNRSLRKALLLLVEMCKKESSSDQT